MADQMFGYHVTVPVDGTTLEAIERYLSLPEGSDGDLCQGEDGTISVTAVFPDGRQADVKCCGSNDGPSWTEMVLFDREGGEIACSEVGEEFLGEWTVRDGLVDYTVSVVAEPVEKPKAKPVDSPGPLEAAGIVDGDRDAATGARLPHDEVYDKTIDALGGLPAVVKYVPFDRKALAEAYARDPHLNEPAPGYPGHGAALRQWDSAAGFAANGANASKPYCTPHGFGLWSLYREHGIRSASASQGVCILKRAAVRWVSGELERLDRKIPETP